MAESDRVEWRLIATNLTTQLAILPVAQGHIYFEFNEPGSGEARIPLDSDAAGLITEGMFAMCFYRGVARGGFFIDNIKEIVADSAEGEGRWMSISGRGPLALLDEVIVWEDGTGASTRTFTAVTKASILVDLINERFARGGWIQFDWDFSATNDSASATWTDSDDIEIPVGQTLLDVLRDFASTGDMEFEINFVSPFWTLSAYKNGIGTNKSTTEFFRVGTNCQEVSEDELGGGEIRNSYLIKFRDGYTTASDSTSITNRRRREKLLNLEVAQSGDSAQTFASAKLSQTKDPKTSISVRVYDGVSPFLFVDYEMGDTITLDRFGAQVSYRVLGIQADFNGDDYSNVVVELNSLIYENDLRMNRDLDWLLKQWNTAKDANQQEVKQWISIGQPNGEVYALHNLGDYLYVGGNFTQITGGITASYIARYNTVTGVWEAMGTTITSPIVAITDRNGEITIATNDTPGKIYAWGGSSWTLIGTGGGSTKVFAMVSSGSVLYVGVGWSGGTPSIDGTNLNARVGSWNGSAWSAIGGSTIDVTHCYSLAFYNSNLHGGFTGVVDIDSSFQKWNGSVWSKPFSDNHLSPPVTSLTIIGNNLFVVSGSGTVRQWDGAASTTTLIGTAASYGGTQFAAGKALSAFLADIFYGSDYDGMQSVTGYNNISRYSGGAWSKLGSGIGGYLNTVRVIGDDLYAAGLFTTADGKPISNLAVWITNFESLINHLSHDNSFDMGAAIHQATASAITDNDEMGFWEDVSNALRKITWANIKATLKTYFDAIYAPIAKGVTNGDSHNHVGGDGAVLNHADVIGAFTAGATIPATTTYSNCPFKNTLDVTTNQMPWPEGGTLSDLSVRISTAQPGTGSLVATLYVNGSATSVVVTIAAGAAANTYTDSTHTATINAGEVIRWDLQNNATSASAAVTGVTVKLTKPTT